MEAKSQPPEEREDVISTLNGFIEAFNLAKEVASIAPAKAVFGSASVILAMVRVSRLLAFHCIGRELKYSQDDLINQMDYVELGLACAEVCAALDRGLKEKGLDDLNDSVYEAIKQLTL